MKQLKKEQKARSYGKRWSTRYHYISAHGGVWRRGMKINPRLDCFATA